MRRSHVVQALMFALLLACSKSWAGNAPSLAVPLTVDESERPQYVCVINNGRAPQNASRRTLAQMQARRRLYAKHLPTEEAVPVAPAGGEQLTQSVQDELRVGDQALGTLTASADENALCGRRGGKCLWPMKVATTTPQIVCARSDDVSNSDNDRVLLLELAVEGQAGYVGQVIVRANIVEILLDHPISDNADVTISVAGGNYQRDGVGTRAGRFAPLVLHALCHERQVELPLSTTTATEVESVRAIFGEQECYPKLRDRCVRLWVPEQEPGDPTKLTLELHQDNAALHSFESKWYGTAPPDSIVLEPTSLSVSWIPDCAYPDGATKGERNPARECPQLCLRNVDGVCATGRRLPASTQAGASELANRSGATPRDSCYYDIQAGHAFALPAPVEFRSWTGDTWFDEIHQAGEVLRSYAATESRHYVIDRSKWRPQRAVGDTIEVVDLVTPSGNRYRIPGTIGLVTTPLTGATCDARIRYVIYGDRIYRESAEPLVNGRVVLPAAEDTASHWSAGIMLSGGIGAVENAAGCAFGMHCGNLKAHPFGALDFVARYHTFEPADIELGATVLFSEQDWIPAAAPQDSSARNIERAVVQRWMFSVSPVIALSRGWRLGLGLFSAGFTRPILQDDEAHVGSVPLAWTPRAFFRARLGSFTALELGGRGTWPDRIYEYHTDFRGSPRRDSTAHVALFAEIGLRFWLGNESNAGQIDL